DAGRRRNAAGDYPTRSVGAAARPADQILARATVEIHDHPRPRRGNRAQGKAAAPGGTSDSGFWMTTPAAVPVVGPLAQEGQHGGAINGGAINATWGLAAHH